ncbi:TadE/TadG family type IV pilus assembly protein [Pseudoduganella violaceinigra]|uniref:TadE/TadG family type IV pilus assembly protein n=1 Tax=Pseudoduganella violaceinigra TaxID=246602 RepID=UPI00041D4BFF|nr:hypothetical protein [Pseudoduganella violaceinigra]
MKRRRCGGAAAIEAGLVMLATTSLLANLVYCGRLALNGAALDRAASNAARYLATVPVEVLHDSVPRSAALSAAQGIIDETLAAANVDVQELQVNFFCDPSPCATLPPGSTPTKAGVEVVVQFHDELFGTNFPLQLSAFVEVGRDR